MNRESEPGMSPSSGSVEDPHPSKGRGVGLGEGRLASFRAFWPYYLGEHTHVVCRSMHVVGTFGFLATLAVGVYRLPETTAWAVAIVVVGTLMGCRLEPRGGTVPWFVLILAVAAWFSPWFVLPATLWGYAWAWTGHFVFEKNRPATFRYPFWSLVADLRMVGKVFRRR